MLAAVSGPVCCDGPNAAGCNAPNFGMSRNVRKFLRLAKKEINI